MSALEAVQVTSSLAATALFLKDSIMMSMNDFVDFLAGRRFARVLLTLITDGLVRVVGCSSTLDTADREVFIVAAPDVVTLMDSLKGFEELDFNGATTILTR